MTDDIRAILGRLSANDQLTTGEKELLKTQWPELWPQGGFMHALWEAIHRADADNLSRLARGFPDHVAAFRAWRNGTLTVRLVALEPDIEPYL